MENPKKTKADDGSAKMESLLIAVLCLCRDAKFTASLDMTVVISV
jgi:hypothetical protein